MILADASLFIALSDAKDRWHGDALRLRSRLRGTVVVTDLCVAEAVTTIGARKGGKAAAVLGEYLVDNCRIEFLDGGVLPEVLREHLRFDGTLSVSDALSVHVMQSLGIQEILSFDSDFDKVKGTRRLH